MLKINYLHQTRSINKCKAFCEYLLNIIDILSRDEILRLHCIIRLLKLKLLCTETYIFIRTPNTEWNYISFKRERERNRKDKNCLLLQKEINLNFILLQSYLQFFFCTWNVQYEFWQCKKAEILKKKTLYFKINYYKTLGVRNLYLYLQRTLITYLQTYHYNKNVKKNTNFIQKVEIKTANLPYLNLLI